MLPLFLCRHVGTSRALGSLGSDCSQQLPVLSRPAGQFWVWELSLILQNDVVWVAAHGSAFFLPFKTWPAPALISSTHLSICFPVPFSHCCQALPSAVPTPSFVFPSWGHSGWATPVVAAQLTIPGQCVLSPCPSRVCGLRGACKSKPKDRGEERTY